MGNLARIFSDTCPLACGKLTPVEVISVALDLRITRWAGKDTECVSSSAVNINSVVVWGRVLILIAAWIHDNHKEKGIHDINPHCEGVLGFWVTH